MPSSSILGSKGLAKLGKIVGETLFLVMFPGVAKNNNRGVRLLALAKYIDYSRKQFESKSK